MTEHDYHLRFPDQETFRKFIRGAQAALGIACQLTGFVGSLPIQAAAEWQFLFLDPGAVIEFTDPKLNSNPTP